MNDEDIKAIEALQDKEDQEELSKPDIVYTHLGSEMCPIDPEDTEIEFSMLFRIPKIEHLEECKNLRVRLDYFSFLILVLVSRSKKEPYQENWRTW